MPTISINRNHLFEALNHKYTDDEFSDLLFDFGLELDDILQEDNGDIIYKIEIGANRYDLLCLEGLVSALSSYKHGIIHSDIKEKTGNFVCNSKNNIKTADNDTKNCDFNFDSSDNEQINNYKQDEYIVYHQNKDSRPFIACAVIHNIKFSKDKYERFIDYQDKINSSLGRDRSIAAIGTHDLQNVQFPVFYKSIDPETIKFVSLNGTEKEKAVSIKERYLKDSKMKMYAKLLKKNDKYPFFIDSNGFVLSLPPLINSDYSKIDVNTTSIFIEITGTDFNKVNMALKYLLYNFRGEEFSKVQIQQDFTDESKEILGMRDFFKIHETGNDLTNNLANITISNKNRSTFIYKTPVFQNKKYTFSLKEINLKLGLSLEKTDIMKYLERMMYNVIFDNDLFKVNIPDSRSDVLHKCDVFEDIAIAHGFNNFTRSNVNFYTIAVEDQLNKFCDKIRKEIAECGYNEVLTLSLLSKRDSLSGSDDKKNVVLSNPNSLECEVVRNSLLPGILKSISSNKHVSIPLKIFEVSDVVRVENYSIFNEKRLCACFAGKNDGFENIIGLVSKLLEKIGFGDKYEYKENLNLINENIYFKKRAGWIFIRTKDNKEVKIGSIGVLNPQIMNIFKIPFAISSFEINVDLLFKIYNNQ